jgi:hypothetical protein
LIGLSRSTIWRLIKEKPFHFPRFSAVIRASEFITRGSKESEAKESEFNGAVALVSLDDVNLREGS